MISTVTISFDDDRAFADMNLGSQKIKILETDTCEQLFTLTFKEIEELYKVIVHLTSYGYVGGKKND